MKKKTTKTIIHWRHWLTGDDSDFLTYSDLKPLVKKCQAFPKAKFLVGEDSEGSTFYVLSSGDTSKKAITRVLDKENDK